MAQYPPKPKPGDRVAIVSPSSGLPGLLPLPHDLGLQRLRDHFGLEPVEYPTTRRMGSTPQDRARDINAAFADPTIKAVIASIGGSDQLTVLPHLDDAVITANPKPFFGYSDNTNLLLWLANRGIVAYHGACVMVELGRPGRIHPLTEDSLRRALFTHGEYQLTETTEYGDVNQPWDDPATFTHEPPMHTAQGWRWHQPKTVEGTAWGGEIEVLSWMLMADKEIHDHPGRILFLETSEEQPTANQVYWILRSMGERGLLSQIEAALVGRAKAWSFDKPDTDRATYQADQRTAVLKAFAEYNPHAAIVFDVDLGHTDPQLVIPVGGTVRIDGEARTITVTY